MLYSIVSISIVLIVMVILSLISPKEKADTVEIPYSPDNIKILNRVFEKDYRNPLETESNFGVKIEYPEITGLKTNGHCRKSKVILFPIIMMHFMIRW